jgi:hypothetical protein
MSPSAGWYGFDLDGTLAFYDGWKGDEHIGDPIPSMVTRVQAYLALGRECRIMTARMSAGNVERQAFLIGQWTLKHIGKVLPATCCKDYNMVELWDDRAVQVIPNTGIPVEKGR